MNKTDFLNAICGKPVTRDIDGLEVQVRSLTTYEMETIDRDCGEDKIKTALYVVLYGLVDPKLDKEDLELLGKGRPGTIMKLSEEIMNLSGLVDSESSPTGGNG